MLKEKILNLIGFLASLALGLMLLVWSGSFLWELASLNTRYQIEAERNTTHYSERTSEQIKESCTPSNPLPRDQCIEEIIKSSHENQRNEADLYAQRQMADWAYAMTVIGSFSILLTIAGIYFVRENLIEMQRTRKVSEDAVKAAQDSNAVAREIGEAQVRAYLSCTVAQISISKDGVVFSPIVENSGQTPADKIRISAIVQHLTTIEENGAKSHISVTSKPAAGNCQVVSAQGGAKGTVLWSKSAVGDSLLALLIGDSGTISARAKITWSDVFKKEQTVSVVCFLGGEDIFVWGEGGAKSSTMQAYNEEAGQIPRHFIG